MIAYAVACVLSGIYAGCYAAHALNRRRFTAFFGALLLALCAAAGAAACLLV